MDEKAWKDLYREHRRQTRGMHLYRGPEGGLEWSVESIPDKRKACVGFSNFNKEHKCLSCLEIENDPS